MTDPVDAAAKALQLSDRGAYAETETGDEPSWEESDETTREDYRRCVRAVLPILRAHHFEEAAELIEAQTVVDATRDSESRRIFFWEAAQFLRGLADAP